MKNEWTDEQIEKRVEKLFGPQGFFIRIGMILDAIKSLNAEAAS